MRLNLDFLYTLILYTIILQDRQMGAQTSTQIELSQTNLLPLENLQNTYYNKLYLENRKSQALFFKELHSIAKRTSFLHYPWAKELTTLLSHHQERLYSQYKVTLRRNTTRQVHQTGFLDSQFHGLFSSCFRTRMLKVRQQMKLQELLGALQEAKTYLMVRSWLYLLTAVDQQKQRQKLSSCQVVNSLDESLVEVLLNLSQLYFQDNSAFGEKDCLSGQQEWGDNYVRSLLKKVKRCRSLEEKVGLMEKMNGEVSGGMRDPRLEQVIMFLGRGTVLGYIFIVHELLGVQIPNLWNYLLSNMGPDFVNRITSPF